MGESGGNLKYMENTGTSTAPAFVLRTGSANPFDGIYVGFNSAPAVLLRVLRSQATLSLIHI